MATEQPDAQQPTQASVPATTLRMTPGGGHVWEIPEEEPGTLAEIFAAEDSRRQNLVLYALRNGDAFRRCARRLGAAVDPYELILAVMSSINAHLHPLDRLAEHRHRMRITAKRAQAAAVALQELSSSMDEIERAAWLWRLKDLGIPDPTNPRIIDDLRNMAVGLDRMLARGALRDRGGRSKMAAFERLIQDLARIFEHATGRPATITRDHHRPSGYGGRFWDFVEIIRPIGAAIIETSGAGSFAQPATEPARGKFIEEVLKKARTEKTRTASR